MSDFDRKLVLVLTVVVLWLGTMKVLDKGEPAPEPEPAAEVEPETGLPNELEDESEDEVENEAEPTPAPVEIGRPVEPGWTMTYDADLGSPMKLTFTNLVETNEAGATREYEGKLTLHYGDGMKDAYPIIEGEVTVAPLPAFRQQMIRTKTLGVEFKGHPVVEHELKWIIVGVE